MVESVLASLPWIEWDFSTRSLAGQTDSGDRHLVTLVPHRALIAVVDGLGHGDEAAAAAEMAVRVLREYADETVVQLLKRCDKAIQRTRGVVMTLASIDAEVGMMEWAGVGNVEGVLLRASSHASHPQEYVPLRGGVVGCRLPPVNSTVIPITWGDTLVFATDGIRPEFAEELTSHEPPQKMADRILTRFGKPTDDSLVLVARYLGGIP